MAVWFDPAIEFIVREAHQDMGQTPYSQMIVVDRLAEDTKLMALVWNEGEIKTTYNMEQQGVYISAMFEVQIIGQQRRQVGRAMYDFQNALIGSTDEPDIDPDTGTILYNPVAHHNVGGHPIRVEDMDKLDLSSTYEPVARERGLSRLDGQWWPIHIIQKLTVEGEALARHPELDAWRGRIFIHAHIANAGFGDI